MPAVIQKSLPIAMMIGAAAYTSGDALGGERSVRKSTPLIADELLANAQLIPGDDESVELLLSRWEFICTSKVRAFANEIVSPLAGDRWICIESTAPNTFPYEVFWFVELAPDRWVCVTNRRGPDKLCKPREGLRVIPVQRELCDEWCSLLSHRQRFTGLRSVADYVVLDAGTVVVTWQDATGSGQLFFYDPLVGDLLDGFSRAITDGATKHFLAATAELLGKTSEIVDQQ